MSGTTPSPEAWGWELREPITPIPAPFDEPPPRPTPRPARWSSRSAARRDRAGDGGGRSAGLAVVALAFGAGAVVLHLQFSGTELYDRFGRWGVVALVAVALLAVVFAVQPLVVAGWSDLRYRRWRKRLVRDQLTVADRAQQWERRRAEHEHAHTPTDTDERWVPLRPETTQRVDVYGGDPTGRATLLRQVAASLLQSGGEVRVIDLSQDGIGRQLLRTASMEGRPYAAAQVPDQLAPTELIEGLSAAQVGDLVAESIHGLERESGSGGDRSLDATLIERVCNCVDDDITMERLAIALQLLSRQESGVSSPGSLVTANLPPEQARRFDQNNATKLTTLSEQLGDAARSRMSRLGAVVQRLASADANAQEYGVGLDAKARLWVWELSERLGEVDSDLLAQVLFHAMLHRIRDAAPGTEGRRVLVLAGCDRLRRSHLERLDQLARGRGVRLVLFFGHLRDDAVEVLGGSEAVLFMRLGNAKEAENAATFIGKEHRLVASSFTVSRSSSWSQTMGTSTSRTEGENESTGKTENKGRSRSFHAGIVMDWPYDTGSRNTGRQTSTSSGTSLSDTEGTSQSDQSGGSTSESLGYQRTYEFTVEPTVLQRLSPTAFVLVDPGDQGSPRLGDCAPEIEQLALPRLGAPASGPESEAFARGIEDARQWSRRQGPLDAAGQSTEPLPGLEEDAATQPSGGARAVPPGLGGTEPPQRGASLRRPPG